MDICRRMTSISLMSESTLANDSEQNRATRLKSRFVVQHFSGNKILIIILVVCSRKFYKLKSINSMEMFFKVASVTSYKFRVACQPSLVTCHSLTVTGCSHYCFIIFTRNTSFSRISSSLVKSIPFLIFIFSLEIAEPLLISLIFRTCSLVSCLGRLMS